MRYRIEDERRSVLRSTDSSNAIAGLVTRIRNKGYTHPLVIRDTKTDETFVVPENMGVTTQVERPRRTRKRDPKRGPRDLEELF